MNSVICRSPTKTERGAINKRIVNVLRGIVISSRPRRRFAMLPDRRRTFDEEACPRLGTRCWANCIAPARTGSANSSRQSPPTKSHSCIVLVTDVPIWNSIGLRLQRAVMKMISSRFGGYAGTMLFMKSREAPASATRIGRRRSRWRVALCDKWARSDGRLTNRNPKLEWLGSASPIKTR